MSYAKGGNRLVRRFTIGGRGSGKRSTMRRAPHQHQLGNRERKCPAAILRHVPECQGSSARIPPRNRLTVDPQGAGAWAQQTEDRLEQCRFAFAVAPEHAQHFAGIDGEADAVPDDMPRIAVAQILNREPRRAHDHAVRRPNPKSHKNTGVPRAAVRTPSGSSTAPRVRATVSTASR